jgi:Ca-activated chloride channel family protein
MNLTEFLHAFHFLRPWWLLALPAFLAYAWWLAKRQKRHGDWSQFIDPQLLPVLRLDSNQSKSIKPWPLLALVWSLGIVALSGPSWQQDQVAAYRTPAAWMFLLDLSPSMSAADVTPDRVTRARYGLVDLLDVAQDARVGLVAFSDEPYTVTPLTQDAATVKTLLPALAPDVMPTPGDHVAPALVQGGKLLEQGGVKDSRIILLTDGFDDPAAAFSAAAALKARGVSVNVVGVGTANGAPVRDASGHFELDARGQPVVNKLDESALRELARAGGGQYVNIAHLPDLIAGLQSQAHTDGDIATPSNGFQIFHWRDAGVWLLPLLLLFAAFLARRDWL